MMPAADARGRDDLSGRTVDDLLGGARGGAGLLDDDFGLGGLGVGAQARLFSGKDDIEVGLLEDRDQHFGAFPASSCALHVGRALGEELCLMFVALCVCAEARGWTENDAWYLIFGRRSSLQTDCLLIPSCLCMSMLACLRESECNGFPCCPDGIGSPRHVLVDVWCVSQGHGVACTSQKETRDAAEATGWSNCRQIPSGPAGRCR